MHKTPVSANLFFRLSFSHSAVSLAIPSGLLCFHGNPGIKASYVSVCTRASKDTSIPAVILHSSFYFPLGQRLQSSRTHIHPPPINPPLPHSSDRSQTQGSQSNLIITTNKTLYTSPISSSIWVALFFPESMIALRYLHIQLLSH